MTRSRVSELEALIPRVPESYTLRNFRRFASHLKLENGKPLRLEFFQLIMLAAHFLGVLELVIILPKKNGKTTLLAALALFHLWCVVDAECVIGAASRDQATILFRQCASLVVRSGLQAIFNIKGGYREIRHVVDKFVLGRIRVLAADAATADGVIPTLALVDELHRHPSGELYGVFRDGLGPRNGQQVTISTAGATLSSPLGLLRARAHELKRFVRRGAHNRAISDDGSFVLHEWCLGDEEDPADMDVVKQANPASWQTVARLSQRHDSPTTTPWQWLRFACGVWTEGEEPWVDPSKWDALADPSLEIEEGASVWLDVDVASRKEAAQIAIVAPGEEVRAKVETYRNTSFEFLESRIRELAKTYDVMEVAFDSRAFNRSAEILADEGYPMVDFPQSPERMTIAAAALSKLIEEGRLRHDGDKELRAQVLAGRVKEDERGWRFVKDPSLPRPIGGLIALAVAVHRAVESDGGDPQVAVIDWD